MSQDLSGPGGPITIGQSMTLEDEILRLRSENEDLRSQLHSARGTIRRANIVARWPRYFLFDKTKRLLDIYYITETRPLVSMGHSMGAPSRWR